MPNRLPVLGVFRNLINPKTKDSKGDSETLNETDTSQNEIEIEPEVEKKSARERLKDKGLM